MTNRFAASLQWTLSLYHEGILITDFDASIEFGWWFIDNATQEIEWEVDAFVFEKCFQAYDAPHGKWIITRTQTRVTPKSNIALWTVLSGIVNDPREQQAIHERLVEQLIADGDIKRVREAV